MRLTESISSLQTFKDCPRCYWLTRIAGLESESSPAQKVGTDVHKAIAEYHLGTFKRIEGDGSKLFKVYIENVSQGICDSVEHEFEVPIENIATGERLPIQLHGFIDAISTKTHWIHEHKTSSNYWKLDDVATNIQATAYAYAYFMETGHLVEGIRFNILKKNKITCKYQSLETYRTLEDFIYFFNWVKGIYEEMLVSKFEPRQTRFNNHHKVCPYAVKE